MSYHCGSSQNAVPGVLLVPCDPLALVFYVSGSDTAGVISRVLQHKLLFIETAVSQPELL